MWGRDQILIGGCGRSYDKGEGQKDELERGRRPDLAGGEEWET